MENSLGSILSGEPPAEPVVEAPAETPAEVTEPADEGTGEQNTAPPAEPPKEDNLDKARKGLEAAAKAERERRQAAEARAEAAERRARELEQLQHRPQRQEPEAEPKPLRSQFNTEDEWLDARDEWRDRQMQRQAAIERAEQQQRETYERTEGIYAKAQALEGFNRAAFDALPLTRPIVQALIDSDTAPELMAYMAANPAEVLAIAQMPSEAKQIKAMARIEDKLAAPAVTPPQKKAVELPETLTQTRNAKGQSELAYAGPTPLNAILATK